MGSAKLNRRSWTHGSELTAAVLDEQRDDRDPVDPGGLGDDEAPQAMRRAAAELDAWHADRRSWPMRARREF